MNAPLYTIEILRLAASLPEPRRLERVGGSAEVRSPTCGSVVRTEVQLDAEGRVGALSQQVEACAFGQASASLVARGAQRRSAAEITAALESLAAWLDGQAASPGDWPGIRSLAPARSRKGRHGAILLPFRALAAALKAAR